jgi:transcriptional regulatory protein LevR/transcriptional regulator with AAA-type ATPase domain
MLRKEKIYQRLKELCLPVELVDIRKDIAGFDAETIGQDVGVSRNNTSKELHNLLREGRVIKIKGRPVRFFDRERLEELIDVSIQEESIVVASFKELIEQEKQNIRIAEADSKTFNKIIGYNESLELCIKQAKAAILYPPKGLHTLLIGSTGVGKTTFAEMMYHFAIEMGTIKKTAKFNVFNCADYSDNPQLIMSQLFGHIKGAFTGADKDKVGLIEHANGGILLLDEIHRLSPESQEMLFSLIDKGTFRRLGETEITRKSSILLVGATTEKIKSSLLKTFLRRIPTIIKIPEIEERPIEERFELVTQFFMNEAKVLKAPIHVSREVLKAFLVYDCPGNIGQLKADVQLTCARGYLESKSYNKREITIDASLLYEHISRGLTKEDRTQENVLDLLPSSSNAFVEFTGKDQLPFTTIDEYNISQDLYRTINYRFSKYHNKGYSKEQIHRHIIQDIHEHIRNSIKNFELQGSNREEELFKVISPKVYHSVEGAFKEVYKKFRLSISKKVFIALCLHLSSYLDRVFEGKTISYPSILHLRDGSPVDYCISKYVVDYLSEKLKIDIPKEEIDIISMILSSDYSLNEKEDQSIGVIVLAHGKNTASSMADTANTLLGTDHCKAINMSLDRKVEDVLNEAIVLVERENRGKGVLLMVDMGSLTAFSDIITQKTRIPTKSIEMVSTPLVLEAVRKAMMPGVDLEFVYNDIMSANPYIGRLITEEIKQKSTKKGKKIITSCFTGQGSAIKLMQFIRNAIPFLDEYQIDLEPMCYDEHFHEQIKETSDIVAIVGTLDMKIPNVPYISIDEIIIGNGLEKLESIISGENTNKEHQELDTQKIIQLLEDTLTFLNPTKAYEVANNVFYNIIEEIDNKNLQRLRFGFLFHICDMIERQVSGEALAYNNIDACIQSNQDMYNMLRKQFVPIEEMFGLEVADTEIGYIIDLFNTQ